MKRDGRSLSHELLEEIRKLAVQRVQAGESPSEVIASYGLNRTVIYRWLRAAKAGGIKALAAKPLTGRKRKLTPQEERTVRTWICGKDPRQYGFDFGLWTRQLVQELVKREFGKQLSLNSVGRLLARLGITPQKPLRRAYQRDPIAIEKWKREEFPRLRNRAKRRGAQIFFLDEAGVRSDPPLGKTWGARGETPVVAAPCGGRRQQVNAISAVNQRGEFWYSVYEGRLVTDRFIEFLQEFLKGRRKPVFLVVDKHGAHTAKRVAAFVQSLKGRLELHFLPGFAPDLNPDEFVWSYMRRQGLSKKPLNKGESLRPRVEGDLARIKANRALVRSFFLAPSVAYIMAR